MDDWEKLANGLNMSRAAINSIKEYCITTTTVAECYRRELVETYCDTLSSGDPHRVASDITLVLENEMGKEKQAQILRRLFPTVCSKLYSLYVYMCMVYHCWGTVYILRVISTRIP